MKKHIILTVDDESEVLNAILRDLRTRYAKQYRIVKASSGEEALEAVKKFKKRGDSIALIISDVRMPGIDGPEFLDAALKLYPESRRVLLTAYADTQAAIRSINDIGLDYYLLKPWDPPEDNLYPILDDLLEEWEATVNIPYDGIRVAGTLLSAHSHQVKDFLARNRIPYQWLDLDKDKTALELVKTITQEITKLPILFFQDGSHLIQPDRNAIAEKIGLHTEAEEDFYDLIVIGAGPAGLAAGVYGASEGLRTLVVEKTSTGGQAGTSSRIENYLGFPKGLSGVELTRRAVTQAQRLGAEILVPREVMAITIDGSYKIVKLDDGKELRSYALIIASGVEVKKFKVPGIDTLSGAGVYYGAALTEGAHYSSKEVYVLGGGNSAGQGAMFFARYASKVNMIIRRESLRDTMSSYLIDQLNDQSNIELITNTTVEEVRGEKKLERLFLKHTNSGETREVDASALFIFIGTAPRTDIISDLVERDGAGYVKTGMDVIQNGNLPSRFRGRFPFTFETSQPGIFAAGDVRSGSSKRVAAAVGEGAVAVQLVHQFLKTV
ncbi:MAG: FAD-dependent oxidoreductase [Candidatus Heimdallarchaeota archaeon]|nr:FAD-dependent oxidoreductase [Candidatus Heimdallarchaeota archaeon]